MFRAPPQIKVYFNSKSEILTHQVSVKQHDGARESVNSVQGSEPGSLTSDNAGVALDESSGEVKQNSFPLLGLPREAEPAEKLAKGLIEAAVDEVEQLQVFFGHNLQFTRR